MLIVNKIESSLFSEPVTTSLIKNIMLTSTSLFLTDRDEAATYIKKSFKSGGFIFNLAIFGPGTPDTSNASYGS